MADSSTYGKLTDEKIIAFFKEGDERALKELYERKIDKLLFFTFQIINDRQEAHTITSEAFLHIWNKRDHFQTIQDAEAILYTVCRNKAYDFNKRVFSPKKKEVLTSDIQSLVDEIPQTESFANQINRAEIYSKINEAIDQLPPRQKQVILMLLENKTSIEIGASMEIAPPTARKLREQAIVKIKEYLRTDQLIAEISDLAIVVICLVCSHLNVYNNFI